MSGEEVFGSAVSVLDRCLSGSVPETTALPQLLHLYGSNPRPVLAALSEKINAVVANADAGHCAQRAGTLLVNIATFLDNRSGAAGNEASEKSPVVSKALLDHVLLLTGGQNIAAKDKSIRAQGCAMVSALVLGVPGHKGAEDKLLEFVMDKVPGIREKAVRGLAAFKDSARVQQALVSRTTDTCTAVRASAVHALRICRTTIPALLKRVDDVEACVRVQLYNKFAKHPESAKDLGPAGLARLIASCADRAPSVRAAAGNAVDKWHEHLGGALPLLSQCDVMSDEVLGEAVASVLAQRYANEAARTTRAWLGRFSDGQDVPAELRGPGPALFARCAVCTMPADDRLDVVDMPALLKRAREALDAAQCQDAKLEEHDFLLRQLLHIVAVTDVCLDEGIRKTAEKLAESVLAHAQSLPCSKGSSTPGSDRLLGATDLGIVVLRRCFGLTAGRHARAAKHQALETACSRRVVLLVSDLCQPFEGSPSDAEEGKPFTTRLSLKLQELMNAIEDKQHFKASFESKKKQAIRDEDFMTAQKIKESGRKNEAELKELQAVYHKLKSERDSVCHRVLGIITALLRHSNSDLRKDPALLGTLEQIVRPIVTLPALTDEVEVAAVRAICLFCVRDGTIARGHWSLLMELLRSLRTADESNVAHLRSRAAVAACTLADCARLHGGFEGLDQDEVLSAGSALAAVPFSARNVVLEPLCSWLLSLGHVFFDEHLREPVYEVQWSLGWMLVECFKQRIPKSDSETMGPQQALVAALSAIPTPSARGTSWIARRPASSKTEFEIHEDQRVDEDECEDSVESMAMAAQLMQFFNLLPKLPGRHGIPMLSLAVESVAESGLWRRAVLLPQTVDGQAKWVRGFSWPALFAFAHERLPAEMRFRLWRCSLQLCIVNPQLASQAEVPYALLQAAGDAPSGAADMLYEAIALGADADALAGIRARLETSPEGVSVRGWLLPRAKAQEAEKVRRSALADLGIQVEAWAPAEINISPEMVPVHHKMRAGRGKGKANLRAVNTIEMPKLADDLFVEEAATQPPLEQPKAKRQRKHIDWAKKENEQVNLQRGASHGQPVPAS